MSYIDGFVAAVPKDSKQAFIDHAKTADQAIMDAGAVRITECWGDDVPHGSLTDFHRAVNASPTEVVVFSWIEWPDKATRDAFVQTMTSGAEVDPRLNPKLNPMPFDGKRLIFGGFTPVVTLPQTPA